MTDKTAVNILDIENLLGARARKSSSSESEEEKGWKKRLKVAVIHLALLLTSILYAVAGSLIFHSVEMPNERSVKSESVAKIRHFRELMIGSMWNNSQRRDMDEAEWRSKSLKDMTKLTDMLYNASRREFVKFRHLTMQINEADQNETDTDIWAKNSAFFFAITTMATIGYGNVVPVTLKGRIICVFFALFGTPLAIITIGDFGKFLSETIIRAYKAYKRVRNRITCLAKCCQKSKTRGDSLISDINGDEDDEEIFTYEDILAHHIQVPVVLVFGTLLAYIALGGFLFQFLEGWNYINSFYFCFISLTTVGFGDLVPKEHKYMWVMLSYIGVGLAVTTMCIDLVGRQYVWKIHYFGRKFKEADLLQLLRRKRMIERRLAIAQQAAEFGNIDFHSASSQDSLQYQKAAEEIVCSLENVTCETAAGNAVDVMSAQWPVDNVYTYEEPVLEEVYLTPATLSPVSTTPSYYERLRLSLLANRNSVSPSGPSIEAQCSLATSPSVYAREINLDREAQSVDSRSLSGPDISVHCSLATSPSVEERERLYKKMGVSVESPSSFLYEFPLPSPDFEELAREVRSQKRLGSCPAAIFHIVLPAPESPSMSSSSSEVMTPPEEPIRTPSPVIPPSSPLRLLPPPTQLCLPPPLCMKALTYPDPVGLSEIEQWDSYKIMLAQSSVVNVQIPNICVEQVSQSIDNDSDEEVYPPSLLSPYDLDLEFASCTSSSNQTPVSSPSGDSVIGMEFPFEVELPLFELPSFCLPDSGRGSLSTTTNCNWEPEMIFHHNLPVFAVESRAIKAEGALISAFSCPTKYICKDPPIMVTENYCFVVDGDSVPLADVTRDIEWWKPTGRPTHYYYTEDYKLFKRVHTMVFRGKVISARWRVPKAGGIGFEQKEVPLNKVFKVCRYYSYWRTCSHYHRVVTVMSPVLDSVAKEINFQKRIFVQFLWGNAKTEDKNRVLLEYSMKPQIPHLAPPTPTSSSGIPKFGGARRDTAPSGIPKYSGSRRDTYHFGSKNLLDK